MYQTVDPSALQDWIGGLQAYDRIGLDTEFMRISTYWPQLALLQVGAGESVFVLDPLALTGLEALAGVCAAAKPQKVMHAAGEDLAALRPYLGQGMHALFDTQVAAAFAGLGSGVGYQRLVQDVLQVALHKRQTRSDWLRRPLSQAQLDYAAEDACHLLPLQERLSELLERRGTLSWCLEECAHRTRTALAALDGSDPQPHHAFKNLWKWPRDQQARLRRILFWREEVARSANRPRAWVVDNEVVVDWASQSPDLSRLVPGTRGGRGWDAAHAERLRALLCDEAEAAWPELVPIPAPLRGEEELRFQRLRQRIDALAQQADLPTSLLCARRTLEQLVLGQLRVAELARWRQDLLQGALRDEGIA